MSQQFKDRYYKVTRLDSKGPLRQRLHELFHSYAPIHSVVLYRYGKDNILFEDATKWRSGVVVEVEYLDDDWFKYYIQQPGGKVEIFPIYLGGYLELDWVNALLNDFDENIKVLKQCDSFKEAITYLFDIERDGGKVLEEI